MRDDATPTAQTEDEALEREAGAPDTEATGREAPPDSETEAPERAEAVPDFFSLHEVFHRVVVTAHHELTRPNRLLFWSGLAGGLVLGLSLVARAAMTAAAPDNAPLVGNLLYPIGFIILILGRYQLFTENTLTPVTLVLMRRASVRDVLRLWALVLIGNLLGALVFAAFLGPLHVLTPEASELAVGFGEHLVSEPWVAAFGKAVLAGWILAIIVWLVHAARETFARIAIIWLLIYVQVTANLFHSIVGALEVQYAMFHGAVTPGAWLVDFQIPVTLGNAVGGVVFVAVLNYIQLDEEDIPKGVRHRRLSTREWLLGSDRADAE